MPENILEPREVGKIEGDFIVEDYQRGYRWDEEVEILLDDLNGIKNNENYCLQPIVVKKVDTDTFELIDGQQRLTSLFIIQKYLQFYIPTLKIKYSINYKTRPGSKEFLNQLDFKNLPYPEQATNWDELFILKVANRIKNWFETQYPDDNDITNARFLMSVKLNQNIFVIWYQVDSSENSKDLFIRLNIGKIPLTNAELIKALFLSRNSGVDDKKQIEIASEWDSMEKELHGRRFWAFITNKSEDNYPVRIELLFDMIAGKLSNNKNRDKFFTFFYFIKQITEKKQTKEDLWVKVRGDFEHLKEWYSKRDLYHKIGYLIAVDAINLEELIDKSDKVTKSEIETFLNDEIKKTLQFEKSYDELSYTKDYEEIEKILLLFNIETTRQINDESSFFPFEKHKGNSWSLEHIHAQHSEGLDTVESCQKWLELHASAIEEMDSQEHNYNDLVARMRKASKGKKLNISSTFNNLFEEAVSVLSEKNASVEYKHTVSNMALLSVENNAALNNSTFSVKRDAIIEMDKEGVYIPICTRRVFLKYYTSSKDNNMFFWGAKDREAYINEMNKVLKEYLKERIDL